MPMSFAAFSHLWRMAPVPIGRHWPPGKAASISLRAAMIPLAFGDTGGQGDSTSSFDGGRNPGAGPISDRNALTSSHTTDTLRKVTTTRPGAPLTVAARLVTSECKNTKFDGCPRHA